MHRWATMALFFSCVVSFSARATTWYVDADAPGGGDGLGWNTAFTAVELALEAASFGDEIHIAGGVYKPDTAGLPDPRDATFTVTNGLTLKGGYAGYGATDPDVRDFELYETVFSGDIGKPNVYADNCYHVTTVLSSAGGVSLDGLAVTGGATPHGAAGILASGAADLSVIDCNLHSNRGNAVLLGTGSYLFEGCRFEANITAQHGGAVYLPEGSVSCLFDSCTFVANTAGYGGALYFRSGAYLKDCHFEENRAAEAGGAISSSSTSVYVFNSSFRSNRAENYGGGVVSGPIEFNNCLFHENESGHHGGVSMNGYFGSTTSFTNCTAVDNRCSTAGGVSFNENGTYAWYKNCVLVGNGRTNGQLQHGYADSDYADSYIDVDYCLVEGGRDAFDVDSNSIIYWGINIAGVPQFAGVNDFRLVGGSLGIDAGSNDLVSADTVDLDGDGDVGERTPLDLQRGPRFVDDPDTAETGVPVPGYPFIVDMGAYEYSPDCNSNDIPDWIEIADGAASDCNENTIIDACEDPPFCPVDLDGNCAVGPGDVGVVKNHFGCDISLPECAALDFDNNGAVGPGDVGYVKNLFGPCVSE